MTDNEDYSGPGLVWDEIEAAVGLAFSIWTDSEAEVKFASKSWQLLGRAGLTDYDDDFEKAKVMARFLALAAIYHDFCGMAWDEWDEPQYSEWADELDFPDLRLGQLAAYDPDFENQEESPRELYLRAVAEDVRSDVYRALLDGFGGESEFFVALWRTGTSSSSWLSLDEDEEDEPESDWEILNTPTPEKGKSYEWIVEGCYSLWNVYGQSD